MHPEGCVVSIEAVYGEVSFFDVQSGRNSCKFSPQ